MFDDRDLRGVLVASTAQFMRATHQDSGMTEELGRVLREVRDTLLSNPVSPRVETAADINNHYCRYVAETIAERVSEACDVTILEDGGGYAHVWLACEGRHYDAECVEGVTDYRNLPFFRRHREAVVHPEPGSSSQSAIRHRGVEPLYPDL